MLAWLQGTQAWAVPARMAANDTEGWRTAVEAEGAANEELESRYWVTHTLCRAAVAANRGVIGRVPGLVPPERSEGDDERIVAWLAGPVPLPDPLAGDRELKRRRPGPARGRIHAPSLAARWRAAGLVMAGRSNRGGGSGRAPGEYSHRRGSILGRDHFYSNETGIISKRTRHPQ